MSRKKEEIKDNNLTHFEQVHFFELLSGFSESKKLKKEIITEIFRSEIQKVINKSFDPEAEIEIQINEDEKTAKLLNVKGQAISKESIDSFYDGAENSEVHKFIYSVIEQLPSKEQSKYSDGDEIVIEFTFGDLPQRSKAAILNGVRSEIKIAEQVRVQTLFEDKIGQNFQAEVNTAMKFGYDVEIHYDGDHFRAFLPKNKANRSKKLNPGSIIEVILEKINLEKTAFSLEVSMIDPKEVEKALKEEIYEIENGDIEIVKVERDGGNRTKVAVRSNPSRTFDFDVIGSIFGEGAKRILAVSERVGESIDIVRYSDNKKEFIKNAISPIKPVDVLVTKNFEKAFAIVHDEDVTKAIGRRGINVELASKLTQIKIEVLSVSDADKKKLPYNKDNLHTTPKSSLIDKPLFKKSQPKINKKSKAAKFLDAIEMERALSNFDEDLQTFISQDVQLEQQAQKASPKPEKVQKQLNSQDIESIFDELNNTIESEESTKYDFVENLNEMWDPSFVDGDEEFDNLEEQVEKEEVKENKKTNNKENKTIIKEYKKIKDFKVDNDLANYGLDSDIDLSDFDEDDWK
ncbi:NusA N-terminal domain-containing protein [Mycoplasmopsis edwardii]|uniref:Transcription termination factor NusA n=1 Tax=Mycoplasmopsis edwardii TaxID=53558 RepID=A0ACD4PHK2_9BACT|nr:transcription termination factor NusA [Mycoplasmopsis edwardii]WBP84120.1 transcription termination factor NusA [Mycoplasmopsis edwardii]